MKTLLDNSLRNHQTALNVQAYRQQLLASNIANADTPHYKARDIDFRGALQTAMNKITPLALSTTSSAHLTGVNALPLERYTLYRTELQSAVDGNTVNMDVERAAFAENSIHYEASVTFINGLLSGMQRAISGQ
ncbi:flagellar basal body rod protein FlgB [Pseudothauera lacus]|uniref:Flagellar basal body rod protein FlgB n=1 Tax=Pseudothauera lacus TaxID=2136175 RepID=A0A2T4IHU6_9RHOO|nr:flagellar basal body rod protein FlgB [Pseudothauera lacus]PTD97344.1 flagellar basal body rod protein FlgB [Pseudothauera lacus]